MSRVILRAVLSTAALALIGGCSRVPSSSSPPLNAGVGAASGTTGAATMSRSPAHPTSEARGDDGDGYSSGHYFQSADGSCQLHNEYDDLDALIAKLAPGASEAAKQELYPKLRADRERQCLGQEIWYKATGGGGRFHAYVSQQRIGAHLDWGWVLAAPDRAKRFDMWGIINDSECCVPGADAANPHSCRNAEKQSRIKRVWERTWMVGDRDLLRERLGAAAPESTLTAHSATSYLTSLTLDQTYGWDYCPGDELLLAYVARPDLDYTKVDPACGLASAVDVDDTAGTPSSCYLEFGTSTGALGFRKFPNPRFSAARWQSLNCSAGESDCGPSSWKHFSRRNDDGTVSYDSKDGKQRLEDTSVEPPFYVGETCGSCHIGLNAARPPTDRNNPAFANVLGDAGNIYLRMSQIMAAGVKPDDKISQFYLNTRSGVVDTSAHTNDYIFNPGTFNGIINFDKRPGVVASRFNEYVPEFDDIDDPTVSRFMERVEFLERFPDRAKFDARQVNGAMKVPHILKDGSDSVGPEGAVQRVYLNIFACSETCLLEHLDNMFELVGRGSQQTEFNIAQCRRDCPAFRAIESRLDDVVSFLIRRRPTDLVDAVPAAPLAPGTEEPSAKNPPDVAGKQILDNVATYGDAFAENNFQVPAGATPDSGAAFSNGKRLYIQQCARCHSSAPLQGDARVGLQDGPDLDYDVASAYLLETDQAGVRLDWLGSDARFAAETIGTNRCRSLHSNHMPGRLWGQYASQTFHELPIPQNMLELPEFKGLRPEDGGGRGYYRAPSLLSVWRDAPFGLNNGIGVELAHYNVTKEKSGKWVNFDVDGVLAPEDKWARLPADPSITGRVRVYLASMEKLLTPPESRSVTRLGDVEWNRKVTLTSMDTVILRAPLILPALRMLPEQPRNLLLESLTGLKAIGTEILVTVPKGFPVIAAGSLNHKKILDDLMTYVAHAKDDESRLARIPSFQRAELRFVPFADAALKEIIGIQAAMEFRDRLTKTDSGEKAGVKEIVARMVGAGYLNCSHLYDDDGHRFGTELAAKDKRDLIHFMLSL